MQLSRLDTLCVSSAASFSQFATSLSCADTFFGSFCNGGGGGDDDGGGGGGDDGDVGNVGGGDDCGDGVDDDNLHEEASRGVDKRFPNGPSHQEDKKA